MYRYVNIKLYKCIYIDIPVTNLLEEMKVGITRLLLHSQLGICLNRKVERGKQIKNLTWLIHNSCVFIKSNFML